MIGLQSRDGRGRKPRQQYGVSKATGYKRDGGERRPREGFNRDGGGQPAGRGAIQVIEVVLQPEKAAEAAAAAASAAHAAATAAKA